MGSKNWIITAAASAVAAILLTIAFLWLPFGTSTIVLAIGVVVFLGVLSLNPAYVYRRLAFSLLPLWGTTVAVGRIRLSINDPTKFQAEFSIDPTNWIFHIVVVSLVFILLLFDYLQTQRMYGKVSRVAEGRIEATNDTERERLIRNVPADDRAFLVLSALEADSEMFPVDTTNLTKAQQHEVVIRQIEAREKAMLAKERRWWMISAITIIAIIVMGAVASNVFSERDGDSEPVSIPNIRVQLLNSGAVDLSTPTRGEYVLWLPGGTAQHYSGAYELLEDEGQPLDDQVITISPGEERFVRVYLTNQKGLAGFLTTGDYTLQLIFRTDQDGRNMVFGHPIAFTERNLNKYFFSVDLFESDSNQ